NNDRHVKESERDPDGATAKTSSESLHKGSENEETADEAADAEKSARTRPVSSSSSSMVSEKESERVTSKSSEEESIDEAHAIHLMTMLEAKTVEDYIDLRRALRSDHSTTRFVCKRFGHLLLWLDVACRG
ncbi:hypothetical protein PMAYCL1PPCAC_04203, partial [Pristionchus mayeri]